MALHPSEHPEDRARAAAVRRERAVRLGIIALTLGAAAAAARWPAPRAAPPRYRLTDLGTLGGTVSHALGINNLGQVVGHSYAVGGWEFHAFVYDGDRMIRLGEGP